MDATVAAPELTKKLTFENSVIEKIAGLVCRSVDGVLSLDGGMMSELADRFSKTTDPTKGIDAEVGENRSLWIWKRQLSMVLMPGKSLTKFVVEHKKPSKITPGWMWLRLI